MAKRFWSERRVLITGASSGIGAAVAEQLARKDCFLVLTARRTERLESLAAAFDLDADQYLLVPGDITDPAHRAHLFSVIDEELDGLDVLINNAGIGAVGSFDQADAERLRHIMEVNFFAPVELIRELLPLLERSDQPVIANVGSVLSQFAVPDKSEYCASKFALRGFSEALRYELREDGIAVVNFHPNTTRSEFFDNLVDQDGELKTNPLSMSPEKVAAKLIKSIERRSPEVTLTLSGKAVVWAKHLFPKLTGRIVGRLRQP